MKKNFFMVALFAILMSCNFAFADNAVNYYGGPVISNSKVHVIFWGVGVDAQTQQNIVNFYKALVHSTYMDQLAEFSTPSQKIGRGTVGETITITPSNPSKTLTQADVEQELEQQIAAGKLPKPDANTIYMLNYSNDYTINISFGGSCSSWGADHEVYKSAKFGNVYYAMFPCNVSDMGEYAPDASHELAEAVVDPVCPLANQPSAFPAAWITSDGNEISDICNPGTAPLTAKDGSVYQVSTVYLNSTKSCNTNPFVEN